MAGYGGIPQGKINRENPQVRENNKRVTNLRHLRHDSWLFIASKRKN